MWGKHSDYYYSNLLSILFPISHLSAFVTSLPRVFSYSSQIAHSFLKSLFSLSPILQLSMEPEVLPLLHVSNVSTTALG